MYCQYEPFDELKPFVDCLWAIKSNGFESFPPELVLPDGKTELIFDVAGSTSVSYDGQKTFSGSDNFVFAGQIDRSICLRSSGMVEIVSARFHPGTSCFFFDFPMDSVTNEVPRATDLIGMDAKIIEDKISKQISLESKISVLQNFLLSKLKNSCPRRIRTKLLVSEIIRNNGINCIENMCDKVNLNQKKVERDFNKFVGLSPKKFSGIVQFRYSIKLKSEMPAISLTDLALEAGFYDLAHFSSTFKKYTNMSPTRYFASSHYKENFFGNPF